MYIYRPDGSLCSFFSSDSWTDSCNSENDYNIVMKTRDTALVTVMSPVEGPVHTDKD